MIHSAALTSETHAELASRLLRSDGQEDMVFATWHPSRGRDRLSALVGHVLAPLSGERSIHGNVSFEPEYFERALRSAAGSGGGLAMIHSHLGPGWQGMSADDVDAEHGHAPAAYGATSLPLVGLTLGTDGALSARFWMRSAPRAYDRVWCESVRVVGNQLAITFDETQRPAPRERQETARTVSAWGAETQALIERLRVGVVGAGSVGAIVAEALARTGVGEIRLIDFDVVKPHNLDRLLHASATDARLNTPKVTSLRRALELSAVAASPRIEALEVSVTDDVGLRAALDCDVLFSCVDRPWPRQVLNLAAYAHLIPVIDGGVLVRTRGGRRLTHAAWRAHVAAPGRRCLECLKQYDPGLVPVEQLGHLDDPHYIEGLPKDHLLRARENVFGFSLAVASLEVLQFLSMVVAPSGITNVGAQTYNFVTGILDSDRAACDEDCLFSGSLLGLGDNSPFLLASPAESAEAELRPS